MSKKLFGNGEAMSLDDLNSEDNLVSIANQSTPTDPTEPTEPIEPIEPVEPAGTKEPVDPATPPVEPTEPTEPTGTKVVEPNQPTPFLDINVLNKDLETNFESIDSLKQTISKASKVDELEDRVKEVEDLRAKADEFKEKYELLLENTDPKTFFADDSSIKLELFKKSNPSKDAAVAHKIFSIDDVNKVDDFDIVKLGYKLDFPNLKGGDEAIKEMLAEEYNVDPELEIDQWPVRAQNKLLIEANKFRNSFNEIKKIEVPGRLDVDKLRNDLIQERETKISTLKESWNKSSEALKTSDELKKLKFQIGVPKDGEQPEYFEWDLDSVPSDTIDNIVNQMISSGVSPTDDNLASVKDAVRLAVEDVYKPQIMAKYKEAIRSEWEAEHLKKTHNPEPLHDSQNPTADVNKEKKELTDFVRGSSNKFKRKPLFSVSK